jgi:hypothetical protein
VGETGTATGRAAAHRFGRAAFALVGLALATGLALLAGGTNGRAAASRGLGALAHVDPGGGYAADVWAHDGYAYLGSWHGADCPRAGVRVFDLADPRNPQHVSSFGLLRGTWAEKTIVKEVRTRKFAGDLAATSFQSCRRGSFQGFGLFDVSDPRRPRRLALQRLQPRGAHELWLAARGDRAYVFAAIPASEILSSPDFARRGWNVRRPGMPDLRIFDVSNPRRPRLVGTWGAWRELGISPVVRRGVNLAHSVITDPAVRTAFVSYSALGTVILDVSNPSRPRYIGRTRFLRSEQGHAHSAALAHRGTVLVETHEHQRSYPTLWDIRDRRRPRRLATLKYGRTKGSVHDPKVRGNLAYFSWYRDGVVVADITNPRRPQLVARFVPPPEADPGSLCQESRCTRVWGVYPTADYVLASDMVSGLWVLRLG